ncbi:phosphoethanolamine transferase [Conchiformibius kuhniae]|uniref:Phosphoethanolamine transferase n=1 Tax=Conchiformibius kuhniae TaxID=211502 RepID=A0A8T9MTP0_9NEIS|nr:sulfatase-like hydrolase/transferase [Conchiformibius kuhniae]UOP04649.1 sulfatase-like hydrolase/transferase [Conchiformibius kuhniae]
MNSIGLQGSAKRRTALMIALYAVLMTATEVCYRRLFGIPAVERLWETWLFAALFAGLFYTARYRLTRILVLVLFAMSVLANNIHYAVYQSWLNAVNYYLMFRESGEMAAAGMAMMGRWLPHAAFAAVETALFAGMMKWRRQSEVKFPVADVLFALLLAWGAVRAFNTAHGHGLSPDTGYSRLKSHYYAFGYFVGRVLPQQHLGLNGVPAYQADAPPKTGEPQIRNIILIIGESESAKHVSAFGYGRDTTPFFKTLQQDYPEAVLTPAYSAARMTAVALPMLLNAVPRPDGTMHIYRGKGNWFRLAKEQGFRTEFHSAQPETEMEIMNLLGRKWLDKVSFPTAQGYGKRDAMPDEKLLPYLHQSRLETGRNLIVLHQRGSHIPYGAQLREKKFASGSPLDNYDSTVYATNMLIKQVFDYLRQQKQQDWLLVYTSDHGQTVSDAVYHQGTEDEAAYAVPLLVYSPDAALQAAAQQNFAACPRVFHQHLAVFLTRVLGYGMADAGCAGVVNGNLLSGAAGWLAIGADGTVKRVHPNGKK